MKPVNLSAVQRLCRDFLDRENANTVHVYASSLEDFRRHCRDRLVVDSIRKLLSAGNDRANARVKRYRLSMVGTRDEKGRLIAGRGLSPAATNLHLTVVRSLVKKARKAGLVSWELDVGSVADERVHDVRGPSEDLLNGMLAAAKAQTGPQGFRDYAILRLAAELGLRRREIIGLDVGDVDSSGNEIRIQGKARRQKETLACSPETISAIGRWLAVRPVVKNGAPLFTNLIPGRYARISGPAVYLIVRKVAKTALPSRSPRKIGPHKIRHSSITSAVRLAKANGLAREEVQRFSRHKDFRMVARYLDADDKAQAILAHAVGRRLQ